MTPSAVRRFSSVLRLLAAIVTVASTACARTPFRPDPVPASPPSADREPPASSPNADDTEAALTAKSLMVPVEGVTPERVPDTYNALRTRGNHRALDILAPRGTAVLASDAGQVFKLRSNPSGGTTIYVLDRDQRFIYYYAHLERYREGLEEGMSLEAGDVIGYVGTTGNAPPGVPHLHFQIMHYRPDRYWDGEPINPHAFLARSGKRREQ